MSPSINPGWPKCNVDLYAALSGLSSQELKSLVKDLWSGKVQRTSAIPTTLSETQTDLLRDWLIEVLFFDRPDFKVTGDMKWKRWIAFTLSKLPVVLKLAPVQPTYTWIANKMATDTPLLQMLIADERAEISSQLPLILSAPNKNIQVTLPATVVAQIQPLINRIQSGREVSTGPGYGLPSDRNVENWIEKQEDDLVTLITNHITGGRPFSWLDTLYRYPHSMVMELAYFAVEDTNQKTRAMSLLARHALDQLTQELDNDVRRLSVARFVVFLIGPVILTLLAEAHYFPIVLSLALWLMGWIIVDSIFRYALKGAYKRGHSALQMLKKTASVEHPKHL